MLFTSVLFLIVFLLANSKYTLALVPKPSHYNRSSTACYLQRPLNYQNDYPACFVLTDYLKRFQRRLALQHPRISQQHEIKCNISELKIKIDDGCDESKNKLWPNVSIDESYYITIRDTEINILSMEVWGVIHALETILQLVYKGKFGGNVVFQGDIIDEPEFSHRGLLIDTARNFMSVEILRKMIDIMAIVKMNVLHWHITDDQSFPFVSTTYPELSDKGAYHPQKCTYDEEVSDLLEYARLRGVRIIPEFDTPAHMLSWGKAYPDILTKCYNDSKPNGKFGPLNPVNESTYEFLKQFFKEVIGRFHDSYIHLGGNEVDYECWKSNPEIVEFMQKMGINDDYFELEKYHFMKVIQIVKNMTTDPDYPMTPIVYQESFVEECGYDQSTIIHVWKSDNWKKYTFNATEDGHSVIISGIWNLNDLQHDDDWSRYFEQNIRDFGGTLTESIEVLGGEAEIWSTHADETNVISLAWPRGAAVAERLWSKHTVNVSEFGERVEELRCRMRQNNVPVHPLSGSDFCQY